MKPASDFPTSPWLLLEDLWALDRALELVGPIDFLEDGESGLDDSPPGSDGAGRHGIGESP